MKISISWLRALVTVEAPVDVIAARLTAAGLEVEGVRQVAGDFSGVVVAEVRGKRRHPDADQLTLVDVFDGREVAQVVCGASNVPDAGGLVAWARPGATLPGGRAITSRAIRGVTSPGMLCAEDELALGADHAGILIVDEPLAPGADLAALLGDQILEINVTPNRPDCLGHVGIAREVAALFPAAQLHPADCSLTGLASEPAASSLARVSVEDEAGCPRYLARVLTDVRIGPSPLRVRQRLLSLGVRPLGNAVDATNLALLEVGHPLHAFDLDCLEGAMIVVRRARPGETLVTLDGLERALTTEDVLICDAARPIAVAGIMGGQGTGVSASTRRILLESAHFDAARVRRTARRLGLHTEASHRFERGADPNAGLERGAARCARLLSQMTGARLAAGAIDVYPDPRMPLTLALRPGRTARIIGLPMSRARQIEQLRSLALDPVSDAGDGRRDAGVAGEDDPIVVRVPTFRPDLTREIDLIEEIARLTGFDEVPARLPPMARAPAAPPPDLGEAVRDGLCALGLVETVSYAFVAPERIASLGIAPPDRRACPLRIANPLGEELSAMRTSLLPGLLQTLEQNLAHGVVDVRLFEVGSVFLAAAGDGLPDEPQHVALMLCGDRDGWLKPGGPIDFFDLKGIVDGLLAQLGVTDVNARSPRPAEVPWLHPGVGAVLERGDLLIGALGEVHPDLRRRLGIGAPAFAAELAVAALQPARGEKFVGLPRFPGSARDISFFVDEGVPAAALGAVLARGSDLVEAVRILEDYREPGRVPSGKKGMLYSISYRARDRTLTDQEIQSEHQRLVAALHERFQIQPR